MAVLTLNSTPVEVVEINNSRREISLQNTGEEKIYIKKQDVNGEVVEPSPTDYDILLYPCEKGAEDKSSDCLNSITVHTTAGFRAVSNTAGSTLAFFETKIVKGS